MSKINGLTEAEEEMLQLMEEECAELIQAVSKVKRFGENYRRVLNGPTNRENLTEEAADVLACIRMLFYNGLLSPTAVEEQIKMKLNRIRNPDQKRVHYITPDMVPENP